VTGGKTPRIALQRAKEALLQVNAKILGVVINRVNIHHGDYTITTTGIRYYYGEADKEEGTALQVEKRDSTHTRESTRTRAVTSRSNMKRNLFSCLLVTALSLVLGYESSPLEREGPRTRRGSPKRASWKRLKLIR